MFFFFLKSLRSSVGDGPSTEARKSSSLKCYVFAKDSIGQTIGTAKVICAKDPGIYSKSDSFLFFFFFFFKKKKKNKDMNQQQNGSQKQLFVF